MSLSKAEQGVFTSLLSITFPNKESVGPSYFLSAGIREGLPVVGDFKIHHSRVVTGCF